MTSRQAISRGLSAARRTKWMVFLFFGCNLLLAGAVAAPMYKAIAEHVGNSAVGQQLVQGFSGSWLAEFQIAEAPFLHGFSTTIAYMGVLFLLLNTVLSAGAFEVFRQAESASMAELGRRSWGMHAFGRGVGKFFGRFLRIAVAASVFYFVAFWLWQGAAARLLDWWFQDTVPEGWHFYLNWLCWALLFANVFIINAVVEYAKTDIVADEHPSALAALGHAGGFVLTNFRRVMAIYLGLGAAAAATILVYAAFARYFPQTSVVTVLVWFLVAQTLLWVRWMLRLSSWAAAVAFYREHAITVVRSGAASAEAHA